MIASPRLNDIHPDEWHVASFRKLIRNIDPLHFEGVISVKRGRTNLRLISGNEHNIDTAQKFQDEEVAKVISCVKKGYHYAEEGSSYQNALRQRFRWQLIHKFINYF
jgi:hypothetical protein